MHVTATEGGLQNTLYNWDSARRYETLVIVEGFTDLWRLRVAGIPHVACSFGKTLKDEQRLLLTAANVRRVVFFWGGEAVESNYKAAWRLEDFKEVRVVECPDGMEPDTCPDPHAYTGAAIDPTALTALDRKLRAKRIAASRKLAVFFPANFFNSRKIPSKTRSTSWTHTSEVPSERKRASYPIAAKFAMYPVTCDPAVVATVAQELVAG